MVDTGKRKRREILAFSIPNNAPTKDGTTDDDELVFRIDGDDYRAICKTLGIGTTPEKVRQIVKIRDDDDERRVCGLFIDDGATDYRDDELEEICSLSELISLKVHNSPTESISDSIGDLQKLEILDLSMNSCLETIPEEIGDLSSLKELYLRSIESNPNLTLPSSIERLQNLEILDVSETSLEAIPQRIGDLTRLKELLLNNSEIRSLPPSIGRLQNLERLNLSSTFLERIPKAIGDLASLKELRLENLKIASLPSSVWRLQNLECLDLSRTAIKTIPESIGDLSNLELLRLDYTYITSLPDTVEMMTRLRYLVFSELPTNIVNVVERCRSLIDIYCFDFDSTRFESKAKILYALARNRARSRTSPNPTPPGLWPQMLANAPLAFAWTPEEHSCEGFRGVDHPMVEKHDAIYGLLTLGRQSFVGVLMNCRCRRGRNAPSETAKSKTLG